MAGNSLQVVIGADIKELTKALEGATSAISQATGQWGNAFGQIGSLLKQAMTNPATAAIGAVAAIGAAMVKGVSDANGYWGEIDKVSAAMGITTKEAAVLKSATAEVGLTTEQFANVQTRVGTLLKQGGDEFKQLGVSIRNSDGTLRNSKDVLLDSINAINALGPTSERTAAATALLGKSFANNIDILDITPELIANAEKRVVALGLADDNARIAADQFDKAQNRMKESFQAISVSLGSALIPALADLASSFAAFITEYLPQIKAGIDVLVGTLRFFATILQSVYVIWDQCCAAIRLFVGQLLAASLALTGNFTQALDQSKGALNDYRQETAKNTQDLIGYWRDYANSVAGIKTTPDIATVKEPTKPRKFDTNPNETAKYAQQRSDILLRWEQETADKIKQIELKRDADLAKLRQSDLAARKAVMAAAEQQITNELQQQATKRADIMRSLDQRIKAGLDEIAQHNAQVQERMAIDQQQAAIRQQQAYSQVGTAAVSALGQAFESIISGSEGATKAMLKAIVRSASQAIQTYMLVASAAQIAANAGIPGVGLAIGLAGAAAAEGIMLGLLSRLPSASGGWDIPANLGPGGMLANVHSGEMVLPADIAQPLRDSLRNGSGSGTVNIHINAMDGVSVRRVVESDDFQRALREAARNGR